MSETSGTSEVSGAYKRSPAGTSDGGRTLGTPDAKAVHDKAGREELYADRVKVYPRRVYGTFRMIKWVVMTIALSVYYLTPFLRFDRGVGVPDQAVLIDFPTRKAYFFWLEIWPQEVYYATGLLVLATFILFLMTSVAGRVWCGYACPQTVWTDLFIHIERWIQGDRNQRMKLDKAPWSASKVFKKGLTHFCWIVVSMLTGGAFVFYFADAPTLAMDLVTGDAPMTAYLFITGLTFSTYLLGGIAREQVCIYMCPWPRIQSALVDEHSLLVTYKKDRGEERGPHKKGTSWEGRGDCIDCNQCVAVCPMGIDIRDGFQLECIQCALCVDACNGIMDKVERPRGLIDYAPAHVEYSGGTATQKTKILRPRVYVYLALIPLVIGILATGIITRADMEINVLKDRNPLFVKLSDGSIRNGYVLHLLNKQHGARTVTISVSGIDGLTLKPATGQEATSHTFTLPTDDILSVKLYVRAPKGADVGAKQDIAFDVTDADGMVVLREETAFNGPKR